MGRYLSHILEAATLQSLACDRGDTEFICVVHVYDWYPIFIPGYIFSILASYPEAFVRIICDDPLEEKLKICLGMLRDSGFSRFEVIENYVPFLRTRQKGVRMSERWLLDRSYFDGFQYAWIGDVDFLHIREEPTWLERELNRRPPDRVPLFERSSRTSPAGESIGIALHHRRALFCGHAACDRRCTAGFRINDSE